MPRRLTTDEFIARARKVHKGRYDYSRSEYNGSHEKVAVRCPAHGLFYPIAFQHLQGVGCKMCYNESQIGRPSNRLGTGKKVHHG